MRYLTVVPARGWEVEREFMQYVFESFRNDRDFNNYMAVVAKKRKAAAVEKYIKEIAGEEVGPDRELRVAARSFVTDLLHEWCCDEWNFEYILEMARIRFSAETSGGDTSD